MSHVVDTVAKSYKLIDAFSPNWTLMVPECSLGACLSFCEFGDRLDTTQQV
jgi:hypothetical protein